MENVTRCLWVVWQSPSLNHPDSKRALSEPLGKEISYFKYEGWHANHSLLLAKWDKFGLVEVYSFLSLHLLCDRKYFLWRLSLLCRTLVTEPCFLSETVHKFLIYRVEIYWRVYHSACVIHVNSLFGIKVVNESFFEIGHSGKWGFLLLKLILSCNYLRSFVVIFTSQIVLSRTGNWSVFVWFFLLSHLFSYNHTKIYITDNGI